MSEVEETLNRIKTHKSVQGIVIVNNEGNIIRTTYEGDQKSLGEKIAINIPQLAAKAKSTVRDLDENNHLVFLRIKSDRNEIMVAPDKDFMLIVVQGKSDKKEDAD
ncbi:dynein light chain roadblock-type 2 protein (macronuclear) [Tetrahymena thermophila SB210]|uniref:Dynein light chain roadblock n=2 Tax=Tetrahymena thermophila TaxID=5911 RepID=I7MLA8_TETTS|nr:dynein light chain roadblock-type 2 protein [Tetrahymena thermophila SB210]ABF50903.1 dynein light chain 7A [Tetrahymena thermophila]EAS01490.1 dynein light chain roadblock-type 2 protein [Tetrahymena thermophila SB210]|eukprot:XP_001021736.1 dynein light chain roadblock-type 2 protein [Tetrahymena thermophila SB210]